ncbi:hypothetical protein DBR06_SOUSAS4510004, partial [Sousa chinensis]
MCRVAPQLSAPSGAEAGASAGPNELSVKWTGHCSPALRSQPPPPHPRCHCPASWCIKDLNQSHRPALLILPPLPPFGLGAPLHAGCFRIDRASVLDRVSVRVQAPIIPKGLSSGSGLPLLPASGLTGPEKTPKCVTASQLKICDKMMVPQWVHPSSGVQVQTGG